MNRIFSIIMAALSFNTTALLASNLKAEADIEPAMELTVKRNIYQYDLASKDMMGKIIKHVHEMYRGELETSLTKTWTWKTN
jgi:hypothetical protein